MYHTSYKFLEVIAAEATPVQQSTREAGPEPLSKGGLRKSYQKIKVVCNPAPICCSSRHLRNKWRRSTILIISSSKESHTYHTLVTLSHSIAVSFDSSWPDVI